MSGAVTVSGDQKRVVHLCSLAAREQLCVKYEKRGGIEYNRDYKVNGGVLKHVLKGQTKEKQRTRRSQKGAFYFRLKGKRTVMRSKNRTKNETQIRNVTKK